MTRLIENNQIIHIAAELLVLVGLIVWMTHKNKQLLNHIEQLHHKQEEQDRLLQGHDSAIQQLMMVMQNMTQQKTQSMQSHPSKSKKHKRPPMVPEEVSRVRHTPQRSRVIINEPEETGSEDEITETESEIDHQLEKELQELRESEAEEDEPEKEDKPQSLLKNPIHPVTPFSEEEGGSIDGIDDVETKDVEQKHQKKV